MIPTKLKKGDTIGVIAPSNYIEKDDLVYLILSTNKKLSKNKVGNIYIPIKKISLLKVLIKSWRL